jgi:hypothetical protein
MGGQISGRHLRLADGADPQNVPPPLFASPLSGLGASLPINMNC